MPEIQSIKTSRLLYPDTNSLCLSGQLKMRRSLNWGGGGGRAIQVNVSFAAEDYPSAPDQPESATKKGY